VLDRDVREIAGRLAHDLAPEAAGGQDVLLVDRGDVLAPPPGRLAGR